MKPHTVVRPILASICKTILLLSSLTSICLNAQTFTNLANFNNSNGDNPYYMSLVQGTDGNFYGTTEQGGSHGYGIVFKITSGGTLATLYNFGGGNDGGNPYAGLALGTDGNFYGVTEGGGTGGGYGTVFKITSGGNLTTLHSFIGSDGGHPYGRLVQGTDGSFYGTTFNGGTGDGTVFKVTTLGVLTNLHSFSGSDGFNPYAGLVQGTDGNFYGTTQSGGANNDGTVFKITSAGTVTSLHSFGGSDGMEPYAALIQGSDGNLYGTTAFGGSGLAGTVFKVTTAGTLTTLHSFNFSDGSSPYAQLVQGTDGNFYGTTYGGGTNSDGTIFKITSGGTLTTLHNFAGSDGTFVFPGLTQATTGTFYGATQSGGTNGSGTVFSLAVSLGSFVKTVLTQGSVGNSVIILGNSLTGATSVKFNGTAATFTVVSSTEITTKVPTEATTGSVKVVTPGGTLTSNVVFTVH